MTPRYKDQDYQKLAQAIVDDYVTNEVPLDESYEKVARDLELNAHEARRLLEATNVNAHLSLFEKMGEDHRYVEFETLDPEKLASTIFTEKTKKIAAVSTPNDTPNPYYEWLHLDLPDEHFDDVREEVEKVAAAEVPELEEHTRGDYEGDRGWAAVATLEKTGAELESLLRQAHIVYEEELEKLADYMRRVDAMPWTQLEKDAMSLHNNAGPVLSKLREETRREGAPLQKTANHFVVTQTEHALLARCVDAYEKCAEYANALQWFNRRVDG